jgi:hypothetical protein
MKTNKKPKTIPSGTAPVQKKPKSTDQGRPVQPGSGSPLKIAGAVIITAVFVVYGIFHYVMNSEPYKVSEAFIRQNQTIKAELGGVDKCDPWYPIEMYPFGRDDEARLTIDVIGPNKASIEVSISLKRKGSQWRIVAASYKDLQGFTKPLVPEDRKTSEKRRE